MKPFRIATLVVALPVLALAAPAAQGGRVPTSPDVAAGNAAEKPETIIHATGSARVYRTPDYVDVMVGVQIVDAKASVAQAEAKGVMEKMVAQVKALKLAGEELQTGSVELNPRYDHQPHNEPPEIVGYMAAITVRVRTTDLSAPSRIIDVALEAGGNRVDYVQFGIKEAIEAREEAIRLAMKAAKRKARVTAESLDLRLGRVVTAGSSTQQSGWWGSNRYSNMSQMSGGAERGGGGEEGESVVPGQIEVWVEANVTFAAHE